MCVECGMLTRRLKEPSQKQCPHGWHNQISNKKRDVPRHKNKGRRGKGKKKEKEVATAPGGIRNGKQRAHASDRLPTAYKADM